MDDVTDIVLAREAAQAALTDATLDAQGRTLIRAWLRAWEEIAASYEAALVEAYTMSGAAQTARLERAYAIVSRQLLVLYEATGERVAADLRALIEEGAAATTDMILAQLPPSLAFTFNRVDPGQLAAIIGRTTEQVTNRFWILSLEATTVMKRTLVEGVAAGRNPRETARRMIAASQGDFNGGLPRAMVIARTETLDAMRLASTATEKANASVMAGWIWTAHLSERTCISCVAMHGTEHPLDEDGPLDHQQGRCARVPYTKTWAELGFKDVQESRVKPERADAWFDNLPEAEQRRMLGPARFQAWQDGHFPMSEWSRRRTTDGWRDSYVPAPAP